MAQFTTKDLQSRLLKSMDNDSIAARNSIARLAAAMVATKQLEIYNAGATSVPVVLIEDVSAA